MLETKSQLILGRQKPLTTFFWESLSTMKVIETPKPFLNPCFQYEPISAPWYSGNCSQNFNETDFLSFMLHPFISLIFFIFSIPFDLNSFSPEIISWFCGSETNMGVGMGSFLPWVRIWAEKEKDENYWIKTMRRRSCSSDLRITFFWVLSFSKVTTYFPSLRVKDESLSSLGRRFLSTKNSTTWDCVKSLAATTRISPIKSKKVLDII